MANRTLYENRGCRHMGICDSVVKVEPDLDAAYEWLHRFRRAPRAAMGNEDELMMLGILKAAVGWEPEDDDG